MNSYVHQYPAALYSSVSEFGYRDERHTGEALRSGRGSGQGHRRSLLDWLRPSGGARGARGHRQVSPTPAPHHFEGRFHGRFHGGRHAEVR